MPGSLAVGAAQLHVSMYVIYRAMLKTHAAELEAYHTSNTVVRARARRLA
jgi:hypothetical protein